MKKYVVRISVGTVCGETQEEADAKARTLLMQLAESNDGSEVLANAAPQLELA